MSNRILVHDANLLSSIVNEPNEDYNSSYGYQYENNHGKSKNNLEAAKKQQLQAKQAQRHHEFEAYAAKMKRETERLAKIKLKEKEEKFVNLYNSIVSENEVFVTEIDKLLERENFSEKRKRVELYTQWCEQIFDPIQSRIAKQIDGMTTDEIETRKRELFDAFLQESNRKTSGVFRDIIIEADYDPMEAHKYNIKYKVTDLQDPLKKAKQKAMNEMEAQGKTKSSIAASFACKTREMLDAKLWDKVESTPHGHYSKMFDSEQGHNVNQAMIDKKNQLLATKIKIDHYNYPVGKDVLTRELPKGKRVNYEQRTAQPKSFAGMTTGAEK